MKNKKLLIGALLFCFGCAANVQSHSQVESATQWLSTHGVEEMTVTCPSAKYGSPICDVKYNGQIKFRLGCHKSVCTILEEK